MWVKTVTDSIALSGESVEYFAEMKARYLAGLLGDNFAGKLLDYGCGVGLLSRFIAKLLPKAQLHGFDLSTQSLECVPDLLRDRGHFTSVPSELDRDYDAIVAANVMHHVLPSDRFEVVGGLSDRLAGGGKLIVFEHNPINPVTRMAVSRCPFDEDAVLLHPGEFLQYFSAAGLSKERLDYIGFFPHALRFLLPLERRLRWCPAGAQYVIVTNRNTAMRPLGKELKAASAAAR
jgi:SAM-dependent methyltransferase